MSNAKYNDINMDNSLYCLFLNKFYLNFYIIDEANSIKLLFYNTK